MDVLLVGIVRRAICLSFLLAQTSLGQNEIYYPPPPELDQTNLRLEADHNQRLDMEILESVLYPYQWWLRPEIGVAIYDVSREVLTGRWAGGLSAGYRWSRFGLGGMIEVDRSIDFSIGTDELTLLNLGVCFEILAFLGHYRGMVAVGASILTHDTDIDERGTQGWFVDFRPSSIRWKLSSDYALELAPLTVDFAAPVTTELPLILIGFMTVLTVEFHP